jgi:hypothetical protein
MVSTGPDRDQTMLLPEFEAEIITSPDKAVPQKGAKAK